MTVNGSGSGFTLPAGKSITITYQATVNTTAPSARQASTQGNVTFTGGPGGGINTDDPETGTAGDATVTNINTTITWTGATSIDWNDMTNWSLPGPIASGYAPGVSNPAVNDVVIPNVGAQPNIGTTDIGVFSLNISNGRTLTITNPRVLTIGGSPGGDLTLDGIISGGFLNLSTGTHNPLHAKAIVLEQGDQRTAWVFCDMVGVPSSITGLSCGSGGGFTVAQSERMSARAADVASERAAIAATAAPHAIRRRVIVMLSSL